MRKRFMKVLVVGAATVAGGAVAAVAFACSAAASMTCQGGLVLDAADYPAGSTLHWAIDTGPTGFHTFQSSFHKAVANPDKTAAHAWAVQVDAPGTENDRSFAGTIQACEVAPTTTTVAPTTTIVEGVSTTVAEGAPTTAAPVVTDPATTTTFLFDIGEPLVVATTVTPAPHQPLPQTGASADLLLAAAILVAAGAAMCAVRRHNLRPSDGTAD